VKIKPKLATLIAFVLSILLLFFYLFYLYPKYKSDIGMNVSLLIGVLIPLLYSTVRLIMSKNEE